eukprot:scaffold12181_cov213-Isochrysis_galbana.AAC.9
MRTTSPPSGAAGSMSFRATRSTAAACCSRLVFPPYASATASAATTVYELFTTGSAISIMKSEPRTPSGVLPTTGSENVRKRVLSSSGKPSLSVGADSAGSWSLPTTAASMAGGTQSGKFPTEAQRVGRWRRERREHGVLDRSGVYRDAQIGRAEGLAVYAKDRLREGEDDRARSGAVGLDVELERRGQREAREGCRGVVQVLDGEDAGAERSL